MNPIRAYMMKCIRRKQSRLNNGLVALVAGVVIIAALMIVVWKWPYLFPSKSKYSISQIHAMTGITLNSSALLYKGKSSTRVHSYEVVAVISESIPGHPGSGYSPPMQSPRELTMTVSDCISIVQDLSYFRIGHKNVKGAWLASWDSPIVGQCELTSVILEDRTLSVIKWYP